MNNKGVQEPSIIGGPSQNQKLMGTNQSQPIISEGASQVIKKHRSQNSTGSYLDKKHVAEPSD